jgi:hypothetical protein
LQLSQLEMLPLAYFLDWATRMMFYGWKDFNPIDYEKSHLLKPHYPATKILKTIHIQLLCNYPLGITTIVQLSFLKYDVLINKLPCQKIN